MVEHPHAAGGVEDAVLLEAGEAARQGLRPHPEEALRRGLAGRLLDALGSAVARFTEQVARLLSGR